MSCAAPKNVDLQQQSSCAYHPTNLHKSDLHKSSSQDNSQDIPRAKPQDKIILDKNISEARPFACEFRGSRPHTPFSLAPEAFEKLCGPSSEE